MAPEFVPFIVCGFLIILSVVACGALCLSWFFARNRRRILILASVPTLGLLLTTGFCAQVVRQAFFLNEPMAIAAEQGHPDEVRRLLDSGASPDSWGVDYVSPALVSAAGAGHADVVELLLARGANPNLRDSAQQSALQRARAGGHEDVVSLLVRARAQE